VHHFGVEAHLRPLANDTALEEQGLLSASGVFIEFEWNFTDRPEEPPFTAVGGVKTEYVSTHRYGSILTPL
jgi:hypothetical protein